MAMKYWHSVYVPMVVGGLIGALIGRWLGVAGAMGMAAGAVAWLAWETRQQTRRMIIERMIMEHEIEFIKGLHR